MAIAIRDVVQLRAGCFNATRMFRNFRPSLDPFIGDSFEMILLALVHASRDAEDVCFHFHSMSQEDKLKRYYGKPIWSR